MREFTIGKNDAGQRLDRFVAKNLPLLPPALLQKYIRLKRIKVNGKGSKRDARLQSGDVLQLYINDEFFDKPSEENLFLTVFQPRLTIVYEDENLLLADKRPGMVVHADETEKVNTCLLYTSYAPILFISAKTGQRVNRLFELIDYVSNQASTRITTGMLNNVLEDAQTRVQPPTDKGRRLKIYYMTQVGIRPPHFVIFCNDVRLFHFSYQRYLENCIRNTFGLEGTPIVLSIRQKGDREV